MRNILFGSLRTRLILLVLLAVVPALGLTFYSGLKQRHDALFHAQEDALRMAKNASSAQERLIEDTRQIFFALSQFSEIQNLNPDACSKIFKDLQGQSKGYTTFVATKPNGDLFASALPVSGRMTFTDRTWYQQVLKTREFVIGEYLIGRISGKATVTLAYPVLDRKGQLKVILVTGLDLGWLNQFIIENKPPPGTTLNVIDRKGTILLRYPEPEKFIGKTMPEGSILKAILEKREGVSEAIDMEGVPHLYGFTSLDRFSGSVYVSVGIPKKIAFAEAIRDMKRNLIWLVIVAALAIIAAWFGSSLFIMRPVDRLLKATKRLGEGDLMSRAGPRYDRGEIGQLAFAFDQMANRIAEKEAQILEHTGELERKVRERTKALQESEERFRIAAQSASDLIWDWNILSGRVEWFGRIDEILGYEPGEFPRTLDAWEKIIHPEDHDRVMDSLDRHLKKQSTYDEEYRVKRKDGTVCHWTERGTALWDGKGNPYKMIGVCTDITDRKRGEEALRESEERYRKLFENAIDGIALADAKTGILIDCNEAIERLVGREKKELIGHSQKILHPPEDSTGEVSQTFTQHSSDKEGHLLETEVMTKKGERKQVEIKANILELKGVKVLQGFFRDITERKRVEEEIRRLNESLEQRVKERTAQLEAANKEMEAFTYSVSHDLRAPLRAVDGYTQILLDEHAALLNEDAQRICGNIREGAQRMGRLIDDLLAFSRLGRVEIQASSIDMYGLAHSIFFELTTPESRDAIDFQLQPLLHAEGDPTMVRQVWMNLISNALKFSSKRERPFIEVGWKEGTEETIYSIRDNGAGFDKQYIHRLFGVFERLHSPREFEGTGVGLAIVRRIVHRHGGRTWAEGEKDKGATFYFSLPAK